MVSTGILKQIRDVQKGLDGFQEIFLGKISDFLVTQSPVDTGAYVESHSITTGRSNGRMRRSDVRLPAANKEEKRQIARDQLASDIAGLPEGATKVYVNNRSPHAPYVENRERIYDRVKLNLSDWADKAFKEAKK